MLDCFVILTPLLVLGIVFLLAFVGCDRVWDFEPLQPKPPIQITQLMPNSGASAGGTSVKLLGLNLTGVDTVTFGGVPTQFDATNMTDVEIDAISPANPAGLADVVATKSTGGYAVSSNPLTFTYVAIGFVQMQGNLAPAGTSISVTLTNPTATGNLLIAAVASGGAATVTVKDNSGNTFASVGKHPWFQGQAEMFFLANIPGGIATITATGATAPWNICVAEYSGGVGLSAVSANNSPSAGTPGLETINGVAVAPAPGNTVYAAVFVAQPPNTNLVADQAFTAHSSPQDAAALAEDTMSAVSAGQAIATVDTTGKSFLQWVVLAAEIQA